jgi:hypothetical protein
MCFTRGNVEESAAYPRQIAQSFAIDASEMLILLVSGNQRLRWMNWLASPRPFGHLESEDQTGLCDRPGGCG